MLKFLFPMKTQQQGNFEFRAARGAIAPPSGKLILDIQLGATTWTIDEYHGLPPGKAAGVVGQIPPHLLLA